MSECQNITYKKHGFLTAAAMGLSAIVITLLVSGTIVIVYGMHFAGSHSDKFVSLVGEVFEGVPEFIESLPPIVSDVLDDRRAPDYAENIEISARLVEVVEHRGAVRTRLEVENKGEEMVTLLSLRVTIFDADDEVVAEFNEWAATPIAADDDWRGPMMAGSRRRFVSCRYRWFDDSDARNLRAEVEITDIRVWNNSEGG